MAHRSDRGQGGVGLLIMFVIVAVVSLVLGKQIGTTTGGLPALAVVLGAAISLITFIKPDVGLTVLIFSMLLSPELKLAQVPQRSVVIRIEDILLMLVFVTWLGRLALRRELGFLRRTPLNGPLMLFILLCGLSTILGIVGESVTSPRESLFYILKYLEYFMIYLMYASHLRNRAQLRQFLTAMIITCLVVTVIGYVQMAQGVWRTTAPFEGKPEPNTLAGYLVLVFSVMAGLALSTRSVLLRFGLSGACCAVIPPFLATLSRGGYAAFVIALVVLICLATPRQRLVLLGLVLALLVALPSVIPAQVVHRVTYTFSWTRGEVGVTGGRYLDPSTAQRVVVWNLILEKLREQPLAALFGYGVTGIGLIDQQYALVLGELGLVGLLVYLWTRWLIWINGVRILRTTRDPLGRGLAMGFLAGFAGLLIHSFAGNIFVIVRVMEPFWCLAAMVMVLPSVLGESPPDRPTLVRPQVSPDVRVATAP